MIVDLGTGDGRAVLARAATEPRALMIGIDAVAAPMVEASRRAARGRAAERLPNVMFLLGAVEALPGALAGTASLVTATLPWGSLLRGVLGLDWAAQRGVASVVAPGGRVEILASVVGSDHVHGLQDLGPDASARIAAAWSSEGFELLSMRPPTVEDLRAGRSSWARRLQDRPLWRIDLVRCGRSG